MKIGELATRSGLAPSRIRFYEASGLIRAERQANGYREYGAQTVRLLDIITCAQRAGFALEEIRRLLPEPDQQQWKHDEMLAALRGKVQEIDELQKRLRGTRAQLLTIIDAIETKPETLACADNADRVMAKLRGKTKAAPKKRSAQR
ncbi:MAG: MerR family transcriptional regulator [Solimonas sp.]